MSKEEFAKEFGPKANYDLPRSDLIDDTQANICNGHQHSFTVASSVLRTLHGDGPADVEDLAEEISMLNILDGPKGEQGRFFGKSSGAMLVRTAMNVKKDVSGIGSTLEFMEESGGRGSKTVRSTGPTTSEAWSPFPVSALLVAYILFDIKLDSGRSNSLRSINNLAMSFLPQTSCGHWWTYFFTITTTKCLSYIDPHSRSRSRRGCMRPTKYLAQIY